MALDSVVGIGLCQEIHMCYVCGFNLTVAPYGGSFYLNLKHKEAEKTAHFWAQLIPLQSFTIFSLRCWHFWKMSWEKPSLNVNLSWRLTGYLIAWLPQLLPWQEKQSSISCWSLSMEMGCFPTREKLFSKTWYLFQGSSVDPHPSSQRSCMPLNQE